MSALAVVEGIEVPGVEDVRMVADEVWKALLGEIEELVPQYPAGAITPDPAGTWSGVVTVTGEWHGLVTIEMGDTVARRLTAQMLALPADEPPVDADIADAVGEVVNMVGGNVKSLMPGPSSLSLPTVAAGRAAFSSDVVEVVRLDVQWQDQPVRICVHTHPHTTGDSESR